MSFTAITSMVTRIRRRGVLATVRCQLERLWLGVWRRAFGYEAWHAAAPFHCRPYKKQVVDIINALRPGTVVELGCGLGDILSRVRARRRIGIDTDARVIRAARFLHPVGIHWIHGAADSVEQTLPAGRSIDCIVMVNWIHVLSPEQLAALLLPLLARVDYLLLDAVDADGPASYRFKHDFAFLQARAERLAVTRAVGEARSFVLFRVTR